jgi:hypothetical protein
MHGYLGPSTDLKYGCKDSIVFATLVWLGSTKTYVFLLTLVALLKVSHDESVSWECLDAHIWGTPTKSNTFEEVQLDEIQLKTKPNTPELTRGIFSYSNICYKQEQWNYVCSTSTHLGPETSEVIYGTPYIMFALTRKISEMCMCS